MTAEKNIIHIPVLLNEILSLLKPEVPGSVLIDGTLGEGGHAEAFLKSFPSVNVIGIDRDEEILELAKNRLRDFQERCKFFHTNFSHFFSEYNQYCNVRPDRILFDLGVSMYHFKESRRGFSFGGDEELDMRLNRQTALTAADIINDYSQRDLARIFYQYGEERFASRIARFIVSERSKKPILYTKQLVEVIYKALSGVSRRRRIHPATKCFQALRIAVNKELEHLENGLEAAFSILKPDGRMGVISYHSLEDRIVKRFFLKLKKACSSPEDRPICQCREEAVIITKKPLRPTQSECDRNPASRSARLRIIEKKYSNKGGDE
jgi:16S rRNA (cytosine1402-N4)-methyltransferase